MKNQRRSRSPARSLPDEIVMEIISRLPANDVLKFRRVCRRWKALISTQYFAEMHVKANSFPMILVQERPDYPMKHLILVDKWEPPRKRTRIRKLRLNSILNSIPLEHRFLYRFGLSYDGLIVMKPHGYGGNLTDFIIFNPITGDKVSILSRIPGGRREEICGMFFHPQLKEYCIIWGLFQTGPKVRFKMLSLGSQPCCRDLKPPPSWVYKPRVSVAADPVVIDDATIYWMVAKRYSHELRQFDEFPSCEELIMAFDIKTEEFNLMPHPRLIDDGKCSNEIHSNMNILKMDGRLSFVQSTNTATSVIINIWILEDSATRFWVKSHSISIDECLSCGELRAMAVGNGELLMRHSNGRFYACNLELGTLRTFGRTFKCLTYGCAAHFPSFVSLKNCKSEILMEEN